MRADSAFLGFARTAAIAVDADGANVDVAPSQWDGNAPDVYVHRGRLVVRGQGSVPEVVATPAGSVYRSAADDEAGGRFEFRFRREPPTEWGTGGWEAAAGSADPDPFGDSDLPSIDDAVSPSALGRCARADPAL